MAVTLTLEQLADHLRIERAAVASDDVRRTILVELMQACTERVEQYAPDAPRDTQNLAVARFAGYVYDAPSASAGATYGPAFLNSGAVSLLNPWRGGRAAAVHPETTLTPATPPPPVVPETPVEPTTPVVPAATRYFAVKADQLFTETEFLGGVEFDENGEVIIPAYPAGVFRAYYGIAVEHGKTLAQVLFDPDAVTQDTTSQYDVPNPTDVIIGGESYSFWTAGRYFSVTEGHVIRITVEDV